MKKNGKAGDSTFKRLSMPMGVLLVVVVLLSAGSGFVGASFFVQQAPNVTVTTTIFTTTTRWTTSTIWSTMTSVVQGVWTTVQYTTSTSTVTVTGSTTSRLAKVVTANGNARISTAQSKFGGASGLFSGSGAYLSTPDSADWYFGAGDFTIDFRVRFNALPPAGQWSHIYQQFVDDNNRVDLALSNAAGTYSWLFRVKSGGSTTIWISKTTTITSGSWYHVAFVRSGNSWYFFQDGAQVGTTDTNGNSIPDLAAGVSIGADQGVYNCLNGWLDEFRVSKGVARWTSNFTPPTSAYSSDSNTVLLLHMDGADGSTTFTDSVT